MTTRLAGRKTFSCRLIGGSHPGQIICGEGNPQHDPVIARVTSGKTCSVWKLPRYSGSLSVSRKKEEKVEKMVAAGIVWS